MSKGLEALKEIKDNVLPISCNFFEKDCNIIEKELKAWEIVKRTHLNVGAFMILCKGNHEHTPNTTYEQYVYFCEHEDDIGGDKMHSFPCYRMTKEEYELVLEVLYE